ncbi:MAG TPA: hypothetical protein VF490_00565 [Chryseosolibacter sp.]
MKIFFWFFLLCGWSCMRLTAQDVEFYALKKLPAAVNSAGEEGLPLLSPDGRALFFTRSLYAGNNGGKFSGMDVWYSQATQEGWNNSTNNLPSKINNQGHNALVGMSADGNTRYFISTSLNDRMNGIDVTKRISNYWSRPEFVPVPGIDNQRFLGIYVSPDFDVMLISMKAPDSQGEEDLYFSVKGSSGEWSAPKNMGTTLNTPGFEIAPFLSADKRRLYFASNGHKGEGDADIFYSERLYNSWETWSVPVNLGKEVNSKKFDAYFSIYGDSVAYFASNREGRLSDLYEVRVAPVRSVLASGQHYLSRDEYTRALGANVSSDLSFPAGAATLSPPQKELLFFIANKLQLKKDILIHLVVKEQENENLSSARLNAIVKYLNDAGIGKERVLVEQVEPVATAKSGRVEIRLIE